MLPSYSPGAIGRFADRCHDAGEDMALTIDYMLTARCNLECPFCYGPDPNMPGELDLKGKIVLVRNLVQAGVTHFVFAGGEPLISPDAEAAIRTARELGAKVGLQTNAFAEERLKAVLPHLDWLALPLDGISRGSQQFMRTSPNQLEKTRRAVELVRRQPNISISLKIGTVLTPANIDEIHLMAGEVERFRPAIWKLYQVRPRGAAAENYPNLWLPSERISQALCDIKQKHSTLNIFCSLVEQSNGAYLIVNPDSMAIIPKIHDYTEFGHLITPDLAFNSTVWQKFVLALDGQAHMNNMLNSFPNWLASSHS